MTHITLAHGAGGKEMSELIKSFNLIKNPIIKNTTWEGNDDDSASYRLPDGSYLFFTTDTFTVSPIFFPGGDIGNLAFCGTINDLVVMGAEPLGISLALTIEEGFPTNELGKIIKSIKELSKETKIPIVTGDTKVMEKGSIDKIIINTSGIGISKIKLSKEPKKGDKIIISGGIGEHGSALLSKRFEMETELKSDLKPLIEEIKEIKQLIKIAKDPTRGGIAATLNEISKKYVVGIELEEKLIPIKKEVKGVSEMLGINPYHLASEGRFLCIAEEKKSKEVIEKLKRFNNDATIIGEIKGEQVLLKARYGKSILSEPTGRIVPRIC